MMLPVRQIQPPETRLLRLIVLGSLLSLIAGCSDKLRTYPVTGKVVFKDGSPVHVGTIEFKSMDKKIQARGTIETDGSFKLTTYEPNDGAVLGKHQCIVTQFIMLEELPGIKPSKKGVVHSRFASYATSGLELEVTADKENALTVTVEGLGGTAEHDHDHGR